jgi:hypothetical protein
MADVRMVRHTTQTTVTEITFQKKKPLEAWQIYCSLPQVRLSSQGTFIQSYGGTRYNSKTNFYCVQALQPSATLSYALLRQQSRLYYHKTNSFFSLMLKLIHTFIKYLHLFLIISHLHKFYETKTQNRCT